MFWRIAAALLAVGSTVGAAVRVRQDEYIYLAANLVGLSIAIWLWKRGGESAPETDQIPGA